MVHVRQTSSVLGDECSIIVALGRTTFPSETRFLKLPAATTHVGFTPVLLFGPEGSFPLSVSVRAAGIYVVPRACRNCCREEVK